MLIIAAFLISLPSLVSKAPTAASDVANNDIEHIDKIDDEVDAGFITILPDDFLIIEKIENVSDQITNDNDKTTVPDNDIIGEDKNVDNVTPDKDNEEVIIPECEDDIATPEKDVTKPNEDVTTPDEDVTTPDEDVTTPDEDVTEPNEDVTTPDEDVTEPNEDVTTPDEDVTTPNEDNKDTLDEDDKEIDSQPDEDDDTSKDDVTTPDEDDDTSNDDVTTPDEDNNTSNDDVTTPDEDNNDNNVEGDKDNNVEDETEDEPIIGNFTIVEDYKNSMADGSGKMLWNLNVSFNELNASDLLAQHGLYLVFRCVYSADGESTSEWYSFAHGFYEEETEGYNSTGYLNGYIYSIQFAVVDVAPDDTVLGGYFNVELTQSNFKAISEIFYNLYFNANT
jgi:hypothetical protein